MNTLWNSCVCELPIFCSIVRSSLPFLLLFKWNNLHHTHTHIKNDTWYKCITGKKLHLGNSWWSNVQGFFWIFTYFCMCRGEAIRLLCVWYEIFPTPPLGTTQPHSHGYGFTLFPSSVPKYPNLLVMCNMKYLLALKHLGC